ncbi:DUF4349 domain-containing protein [Pedobacter hiemivivus]|uniref:DUF4349 domain-containing protein n=1 Tax=Pedobacter hiemivivus TaxID=2530454 RepID=A0A4R0NCB2_9SPHI|nr:DUF4349 domain-containing protein [Pedobacter hiemivivus]TCC97865.1 DUF4349 domain-containing protein [Pedobacter hiemivivus]
MKKYLIYCVFAMTAFGCNNASKMGESADILNKIENGDTVMESKIIKTADMKFRVKDVQSAKEKISAILKVEGGTIGEVSINSNIQNTEKVKYSADSLLELTAYRTEGVIMARVPSEKLDDFTNQVARMAVFVDHQSLKFDDQSLSYLTSELKSINRAEAVAQIEKKDNKKKEAIASKDVSKSLALKDEYVDQKVKNMSIDSRVQYSDVTLNFYQDHTVKQIVVGNDNLSDYRPPFFQRVVINLQSGWFIFKELILMLLNIWSILVLIGAGYFAYRYYKRQRKLI